LIKDLTTIHEIKYIEHKPRYCEKEKDKANKRSLSFDNNGLAKPTCSCETVALYGPFGFFIDTR
jgi:hypothetical protein